MRLFAVSVPRLAAELRAQRYELLLLRSGYEETLNAATRGVTELRDQLDAQIARMRVVIEGVEVVT